MDEAEEEACGRASTLLSLVLLRPSMKDQAKYWTAKEPGRNVSTRDRSMTAGCLNQRLPSLNLGYW